MNFMVSASNPSSPEKSIIKKTNKDEKKGSKRKLTFKVDEKEEIIEDVYTYSWPSDQDDNEVWWMDDEMDQLLTEAMILADYYTRKRKDWQNKIKFILKCVAGCTSKKNLGTDCSAPAKLKASDLDFVVDSEARGLELYIHPIFQKNREKAIKGVVKVQEDYNASEKKKGKADHELRLKVLRAQSLKLTNVARLMAKTMADGDRRAAIKGEEATEGTDDAVPTEVTVNCPITTNSEELACKSEELCQSEELKEAKPAPRPRVRSPMRTISPRQKLRTTGLKELQLQDHQLLHTSGTGGIGSLKAALDDMPGDE